MAQTHRGFRPVNTAAVSNAKGYSDVATGGQPPGTLDNWATKGNVPGRPSPILDSASVDGRFKVDGRSGLDKAMESLKPAPDVNTDPAPRQQGATRETAANDSGITGGASGSGAAPPAAGK